MNFDHFVNKFNGQIEVLCDSMQENEIGQDEQTLIYMDLLDKILSRIDHASYMKQVFYVLDTENQIRLFQWYNKMCASEYNYGIKLYFNLELTYIYMLQAIPKVGGESFFYRGLFKEKTENGWQAGVCTDYYKTPEGAEKWIKEEMDRRNFRVVPKSK